jgi:hypothetical protein
LPILRQKWRFSQKPMLWLKFCIHNLALFRVKNANFWHFYRRKYF